MLAVGLTLGLFLFWLAVGYVVVHWLNAEKDPLANLLLAPAVGVAIVVLPLLVLSRLGVPVRHSGLPVTLIVAVGAGLIYWLRRPPLPPKSYLPFAIILLLTLPAVGRPMFQFGFDWMSYCNDDMANYCLSARRLYDHGVFDRPTEQAMLSGTDYSQVYWFMHVPLMSRIGVELLMGWTRSVTRLNEHALFMPLILAFQLTLVSAAGAMALQDPKEKESRRAALVVCALLVFSAMTTLGTLFQLIAQVIGLAMLAAAATVVLRSYATISRGDLLRHGVLVGILCTGLVAIYPEVSPFLALAFIAFLAVYVARVRRLPKLTLMTLVVGAALSAVVLNVNLPWVLAYILNQGTGGTIPDDPANAELPYFLVPRGLANLWGFQSITDLIPEPFMSITIGLGAILLLGSIALAVRMAWRENRSALFLVIMFGLGALLYRQRTGFGLFKLSMFMQPFLLATIVCGWFAWFKRPIVRYSLPAALLVGGLISQQSYVSDSRGVGAKFTLIPSATPRIWCGKSNASPPTTSADRWSRTFTMSRLRSFKRFMRRERRWRFPATFSSARSWRMTKTGRSPARPTLSWPRI